VIIGNRFLSHTLCCRWIFFSLSVLLNVANACCEVGNFMLNIHDISSKNLLDHRQPICYNSNKFQITWRQVHLELEYVIITCHCLCEIWFWYHTSLSLNSYDCWWFWSLSFTIFSYFYWLHIYESDLCVFIFTFEY